MPVHNKGAWLVQHRGHTIHQYPGLKYLSILHVRVGTNMVSILISVTPKSKALLKLTYQ